MVNIPGRLERNCSLRLVSSAAGLESSALERDGVPNEDAGDGHRNAEGDEAQAVDAGYDIVTKEAVKFGLQGGVVVVEGMLLIRGELEFHLGHSFHVLIDVGEGPADVVEDFVEG